MTFSLAWFVAGACRVCPVTLLWNRGAIINYYSLANYGFGTTGPDTNGNVYVQQHWVPNDDAISSYSFMQQNYDYDALNRLTWVGEYQNGATGTGSQNFTYDRWGNRTISAASGIGINAKPFTVNAANNRLGVPSGQGGTMTYDAAGNLTTDTYSASAVTRAYDGENRMASETQAGGLVAGTYTYNADGQRVRRKVNGVETWQVYGIEGELLAEYPFNGGVTSPQKEYGYRNGELLVTAEPGEQPPLTPQNVVWTSVSPTIQVTGNSIQKVSGTSSWYDAGAVSSQTITAGDGYMEFTPGEINTWRMCGLGNTNSSAYYGDIEYAFFTGPSGGLHIYESGTSRGSFGTYAAGDRLKVAVEGGVVKYYRNSTLVYTSTVAPTYPLQVDSSLNTVGAAILDVVISASASAGNINWLVSDNLGTPRIIADKTGSLAGIKRHDYLPFGEELLAGTGGRTIAKGYSGDNVRQKFTLKERDIETGLDYFLARYYSSTQGRFTSPDEFKGGPQALWVLGSGDSEKQALVYADITNPQSLNKYQYTFNNPLRYVDPDGQAPQDSFDNKINQLIRQQLKGEITEKQFRESLRGPAVGTAAGLAIIVAARGGAPILTAPARWATQNPDKVQQIAQAMQEGAGGPPGLVLGPSSRLTAVEISTGGRLAKQLGVRLEESAHVGAEYVVAGANKTIDAMGGAQAYQHFGNGSKFFESIVHHVNKSVDYVAVDLAGASKSQVKAVQKFVSGLSEEQRKKIVYVQ